jgi:pyruvyltransferase
MIKVCCDPYWRKGWFNFGDVLSLPLLEKLTGQTIKTVSLPNAMQADIICAGSIMEYIPEDFAGYIWGPGFMHSLDKPAQRKNGALIAGGNYSPTKTFEKAKVLALRGELTKERVTHKGNPEIQLADPAILCDMLKDEDVKVEYELGVVPHYVDQEEEEVHKLLDNKDALFINVVDKPKKVINNIAKCKNIISSSLHGVIVAESLGISTTWKKFSDKVGGDGFKFRDYYSVKGDLEERKRKLIEALPYII